MKKIFFCLIAITLVTNFTFGQIKVSEKEKELLSNYVTVHKELSNSMVKILSDSKLSISNDDIEQSKKIKTREELLEFFNKIGVSDSQKLLSLYDQEQKNNAEFSNNNDEFLSLSSENQSVLINSNIAQIYSEENSPQGKRGCLDQYLVDVHRCERDYAINLGLSWVATVGTGGWGALGFVAAVIAYNNCVSDAKSDAADCRG